MYIIDTRDKSLMLKHLQFRTLGKLMCVAIVWPQSLKSLIYSAMQMVLFVSWCERGAMVGTHSIYHQISNIRLKCFSSRLAVVFKLYIEARWSVENEDVVGAALAGDVPTTSEWATILMPTKVQLILEVWRYSVTTPQKARLMPQITDTMTGCCMRG